jgi:hypothetical protein
MFSMVRILRTEVASTRNIDEMRQKIKKNLGMFAYFRVFRDLTA